MRRIAFLLAAAVALALVLTPGIAFANYKIHGGYTEDTDACAGCHRAHTSVSSITWNDRVDSSGNNNGVDHSALLVSTASEIYEFCYACHGNDAQGADTNVEGGIYKGTLNDAHNQPLNGGFFADTSAFGKQNTSTHSITSGWTAWGGGPYGTGSSQLTGLDPLMGTAVGGVQIAMTCASCHDPHGSSNYRLLADKVNGNTVGGYIGATGETPDPWVVSSEPGYPSGGWQKHEMGATQMAGYTPNYTTPKYAIAPNGDTTKGMSGWCAGCHTAYVQTGAPHGAISKYADEAWGTTMERHRHPVNISLADGMGTAGSGRGGYGANKSLTVTLTPAAQIPLPLADASGDATNTADDWIDCLTCHYAHGASTQMTGYADVGDQRNIQPNTGGRDLADGTHVGGMSPTWDSALLRLDNRGVCEVCHNK